MPEGLYRGGQGGLIAYEVMNRVSPFMARYGSTFQQVMRRLVVVAQTLVKNTAKERYLSGPRPGKLGVVTGRLRGSVVSPPPTRHGAHWAGLVGTNVVYGPIHEFGSGSGATTILPGAHAQVSGGSISAGPARNMPARPFLTPALRDNRAIIEVMFSRGLADQVRALLRPGSRSGV